MQLTIMSLLAPCIKASGPKDARIAFVGEAPGEMEEQIGIPFVGKAGQEFTSILQEVEIERKDCYLTNVLWTRPPGNKLDAFTIKKADCPPGYSLPPLSLGKYLHPDLLPELHRLRDELQALRPNLVVALGNTALGPSPTPPPLAPTEAPYPNLPLSQALRFCPPTIRPQYFATGPGGLWYCKI